MCGINGYVHFNKDESNKQINNIVNAMNDQIIHRGPDDDGIYSSSRVGLGMRRLSIIDLSTGSQPIFNEDKTLLIVFNGEIYNYREIRKSLLSKRHAFTSCSDTEVVLHAYEEYGVDCLSHLDGMFAFAIYDIPAGQIFLARDRAGEKPLYYYKNENEMIFGSELKSLLKTGLIKKVINKQALQQYMQLTYIPAPLTIFENVYKLEAAHYMIVNLDGTIIDEQYWNLKYDTKNLIGSYDQCKKLLREAIFSSVERRMISDVPLGAFLSGGIDSTIMVGIMSQLSDKPIETFTIGFTNREYDESDRAQLVADKYRTNHHIYYLDYKEALAELDNITNSLDEPFGDSSAIPTYMVSKYASQYVKCVLTGDAGDELFAGYSKYLINYYSDKYKKTPKFLRKNVFEKLVYTLPDNGALSRKVRKVIENADKDLFEQRKELMCLGFKELELPLLLKDYVESSGLDFIRDFYNTYHDIDEVSQVLYTDFKVVLEGDMLTKVDRMSMLKSIETRVPMLSKDVIEIAAKIPSEFKINAKKQKIILKDTFSDIIPNQLMNAPKRGFGIPVDDWFNGPLKSRLLLLLKEDFVEEQALFNYSYIKEILNEHFTQKRNRKSELWTLYVFQTWYKEYFE